MTACASWCDEVQAARLHRAEDLRARVRQGRRGGGELTAFAKKERLRAAHFTAIGAFSEVTLGYFDRARKDYTRMAVTEQVEVLSLIGDIALDQHDAPKVHAHVVVGLSDGQTRGGHLLAARVWPTLEVILVESPAYLRKRHDPESGLALIDPAA